MVEYLHPDDREISTHCEETAVATIEQKTTGREVSELLTSDGDMRTPGLGMKIM